MHDELMLLEEQILAAGECPEPSDEFRREILQRTARAYQRHARQRQFAAASAMMLLAVGLLVTLPSLVGPPAFAASINGGSTSTGAAAGTNDGPMYGVERLRAMSVNGDEWRLVEATAQVRDRHSRILRGALRGSSDDGTS